MPGCHLLFSRVARFRRSLLRRSQLNPLHAEPVGRFGLADPGLLDADGLGSKDRSASIPDSCALLPLPGDTSGAGDTGALVGPGDVVGYRHSRHRASDGHAMALDGRTSDPE